MATGSSVPSPLTLGSGANRAITQIRGLCRHHLAVQGALLLACLALFALGSAQVHAYDAGVAREPLTVDGRIPLPAERYAPAHAPLDVVAVIVHGYAANKSLMSSFAVDLAKQGLIVYTFDLPGHGANTVPYGPSSGKGYRDQLVTSVGEMVDFALANAPAPHPRLVLIGYSLGTIAVGEYALQHPTLPNLAAVVLVSGIVQDRPTLANPPNLLILSGQLDLPGINDIARNLIAEACGVAPAAITSTYQCVGSGAQDYRERTVLPGLDHISIVTAASTHARTIAWLHDHVDARIGAVPVDADVRLHWMLLGFLAAILATLPILALGSAALRLAPAGSGRLPGARAESSDAPPRSTGVPIWRALALLAAALAAALLTLHVVLPASFWDPPPIAFLAQQVSGDVATFLLVAGLLLIPALWSWRAWRPQLVRAMRSVKPAPLLVAALGVAFLYFTLGSLSSVAWEGLTLYPPRLWRAAVYALLIWPYFLGVQVLLGSLVHRRGWRAALADLASTLLLLAALMVAIATNFARLSYLGILLPVFAIVLLLFVGFNAWTRREVQDPAVLLATAEALVLAWALAATLPLIG
jgi:dienelactone hydrolase